MIEVKTEKMLCVKCPLTHEWQMLKDCMSCSNSDEMIGGESGKYLCSKDESEKQRAEDYIIRNMNAKTLRKYLDFKDNLETIDLNGTSFHFDPRDTELTDDLIDYMEELSHVGRDDNYTMYNDPSQGVIIY